MAGWRGAQGSSIPLTRQGSGGIFGGQLSGTLTGTATTVPQNRESSTQNVSNTATLPVRGMPVDPQVPPPQNVPGARWGVPGRIARQGFVYDNGLSGGGGSNTEKGHAYGNPAVTTEEAVAKGGPGANPLAGAEPSLSRRQPFPHVSALGFSQESAYRGGAQIANDKLWATDRHGIMNTGTERGGGRRSGETDPPMDGPPRPALRLVQRTINWQQGNPLAAQDHEPGEQRNYAMSEMTAPSTRPGWNPRLPFTTFKVEEGPQYVAEQGSGWSPVYGGVPGLWQPYGSYAGYAAEGPKGIQSPAQQGSAADGPQKVFSGVPHGLHTQTYPDYSSTLGRYLAIPQMSLPRQDRPSNSTSAGQSYNQTVVPQGQTGTVGVQSSGSATPGAVASQAWRGTQSKGWRGIRPGGGQT